MDPSIRKQKPKQSFWVLVNLSTPEASDQILRLTEEIQERGTTPAPHFFWSMLILELFGGSFVSLEWHTQIFL